MHFPSHGLRPLWSSFGVALLLALSFVTMASASMVNHTGVGIISLAQSAADPQIIYAGGEQGAFKSLDHGKNWEAIKLPLLPNYTLVAVHPENARHVIAVPGNLPDTYYESRDAGARWVTRHLSPALQPKTASNQPNRTSISAFWIDSAEQGGAWWAVRDSSLYRSVDAGQTWQRNSDIASGHPRLHHFGDATYKLFNDLLLRSMDRGVTWTKVHQFPAATGRTRTRDFLPLSDGRLVIQHQGRWHESSNGGASWHVAESGFQLLPDHDSGITGRTVTYDMGQTRCHLHPSPAEAQTLLAVCIWDNGAWPTQTSLYRTNNLGQHWIQLKTEENRQRLPGWHPRSFLWDRDASGALWFGWLGGGLYRSDDGYAWHHSDEGLLMGPFAETVGLQDVHEPLLHQAVMRGDLVAVRRLVAQGADINASGNYQGGVLGADLRRAAALQRNQVGGDAAEPMYFELRRLGASVRARHETPDFLFGLAVGLKRLDIAQDLVDGGYDWGRVEPHPNAEDWPHGELSLGDTGLLGRPAAHWIRSYIRAGIFPSADQTVADLFTGDESKLAMQVLKASTKKRPFDLQSTPPSRARINVTVGLLGANQAAWAARVFATTPTPPTPMAMAIVSSELWRTCSFDALKLFDIPDTRLTCLYEKTYSQKQRAELVKLMAQSQRTEEQHWFELVQQPHLQWFMTTPTYRRQWKYFEQLRNSLGLFIDLWKPKDHLVSDVAPESPAARAGIVKSDRIIEIAGQSTQDMSHGTLLTLMKGGSDGIVEFKISRRGMTQAFALQRRPLSIYMSPP